jgi:hypothetical protein
MREPPPAHLIALLERLGLATAGDLCGMGRRVGRLARELPRFESVWIDALAQGRILTPFQAAEINAGRAESLRVGPYLLCGSLGRPSYAAWYRARRVDPRPPVRRAASVPARWEARLAVAGYWGERAEEVAGRLETLAAASAALRCEQLVPIDEAGVDGRRIWAASPWVEGRTAAEWLVHNGRFPPEAVLEIARAMVAGLATLENAGFCHGDVSAAAVMLTSPQRAIGVPRRWAGRVVLLEPGLRAILRPEEGYAQADLLPEAYDYLAPERITDGGPPTIAADVYACGCVWWHMLCGRPPLSGGDSLAKLRAAQAAKVFDVRRLAPEVPEPLGAAIAACLAREPSGRPESMARLAAMLGGPTRPGRSALARCLAIGGASARSRRMGGRARSPGRWAGSAAGAGRLGRLLVGLAAAAGLLVAAVAILWTVWRFGLGWQNGGRDSVATRPADTRTVAENEVLDASRATGEPRPSGRGYGGSGGEPRPSGQGYRKADADRAVVAAEYRAEVLPSKSPPEGTEDLVLAADGPLRVTSLRLRAGQCVRGVPGKRPLVMVPAGGLLVEAEDVRFENMDFVWDHPSETGDATVGQAAMVHLRSARAAFRGCLFRPARRLSVPPVAVRWTHPGDPKDAELSLPSGRLQLSDCVLQWVDAGVDCRTLGALAVELSNTLKLGGGALVRLDHCPGPDEPLQIVLSGVTLRGAGPLLECCYRAMGDQPGEISIQATGCAFVPKPNVALLQFSGGESPGRILRSTIWTGQGSLVSPEAVIAAWEMPDGGQQALDEMAVSIAGLVRSEVGFAGGAEAGPAASRIIRWQVPLRSTDPPGIDPAGLPGGERQGDVR